MLRQVPPVWARLPLTLTSYGGRWRYVLPSMRCRHTCQLSTNRKRTCPTPGNSMRSSAICEMLCSWLFFSGEGGEEKQRKYEHGGGRSEGKGRWNLQRWHAAVHGHNLRRLQMSSVSTGSNTSSEMTQHYQANDSWADGREKREGVWRGKKRDSDRYCEGGDLT